MQKNPLSVVRFQIAPALFYKIGFLLIIVLSITPDIAVSRIAEENDETKKETLTPSDSVAVPESVVSETPSENENSAEIGLFNRNPFASTVSPKHFIWQEETKPPEKETENRLIQPYLDSLRRWRNPPELTDLSQLYDWKPKPKRAEKGIALPMDSNLRITGLHPLPSRRIRRTISAKGI